MTWEGGLCEMFFDDVDGGAAAKPVSTGLYHLLRIFKSPYTAGSLYQGVISDGFFHECHMARRRAPVLKPVDVLTKSAPAFTAS